MEKTDNKWRWPLKNYYSGFEIRLLKKGDAVMLVEAGCKPRNVIVVMKTNDGLFVGENDYVAFSTYGVTWKIAPPSAGVLDNKIQEAAFSEAVWRMDNELHLDANEFPDLTEEVYNNLTESAYFVDSELCAQVTKDTAEDFLKRCGMNLSDAQREKLRKGLYGDY